MFGQQYFQSSPGGRAITASDTFTYVGQRIPTTARDSSLAPVDVQVVELKPVLVPRTTISGKPTPANEFDLLQQPPGRPEMLSPIAEAVS